MPAEAVPTSRVVQAILGQHGCVTGVSSKISFQVANIVQSWLDAWEYKVRTERAWRLEERVRVLAVLSPQAWLGDAVPLLTDITGPVLSSEAVNTWVGQMVNALIEKLAAKFSALGTPEAATRAALRDVVMQAATAREGAMLAPSSVDLVEVATTVAVLIALRFKFTVMRHTAGQVGQNDNQLDQENPMFTSQNNTTAAVLNSCFPVDSIARLPACEPGVDELCNLQLCGISGNGTRASHSVNEVRESTKVGVYIEDLGELSESYKKTVDAAERTPKLKAFDREATWDEQAFGDILPKKMEFWARREGSVLRSEPQLAGVAMMGFWKGAYQALLAVASKEGSVEGARLTHDEMLALVTKSLLETWHEGAVDEGMPLGELEELAAAVAEIFANTKSSHPEGSGTCVESNTTDGVDEGDQDVVASRVGSTSSWI